MFGKSGRHEAAKVRGRGGGPQSRRVQEPARRRRSQAEHAYLVAADVRRRISVQETVRLVTSAATVFATILELGRFTTACGTKESSWARRNWKFACVSVPEGQLKIAQRFNVGMRIPHCLSPEAE